MFKGGLKISGRVTFFPHFELYEAFSIVYPHFWFFEGCDESFNTHLNVLKAFFYTQKKKRLLNMWFLRFCVHLPYMCKYSCLR